MAPFGMVNADSGKGIEYDALENMASFALLCALQKSKADSPSLSNYTSMGRRIILEAPCFGCSLLFSFQLPNVSPPVFFRFTVLRI